MTHFWSTLPAGFVGLSPMDGVSDHPFREIQKKYGQPAVVYTEFTSVEGIAHGAVRLLKDFLYSDLQHPIVGQIFGRTPQDFRTAAVILCQLGFDGIDINMGCPAKTVTHLGCGAALIKTPKLAQEIIAATADGITDWTNGMTVTDLSVTDEIKGVVTARSQKQLASQTRTPLPLSIKTRIGYSTPVIEQWIPTLLEMEPAVIAVHGRTLNQHYGGSADWSKIAQVKEIARHTSTKIIGNGDVKSLTDAREKIAQTGVDGVLIGRASMGNPWIFKDYEATTAERFAVAIEHAQLYQDTFQDTPLYNFLPMRKHLGWYIKGFDGASEVRQRLFQAESAQEVKEVLEKVQLANGE